MDREHAKGAADQAKGAIKDTAGKVTRSTQFHQINDGPAPGLCNG